LLGFFERGKKSSLKTKLFNEEKAFKFKNKFKLSAGLEEVRVADLEILGVADLVIILVVEIVTERDVENQMRVLVGEDLEMKVLGMAVFSLISFVKEY